MDPGELKTQVSFNLRGFHQSASDQGQARTFSCTLQHFVLGRDSVYNNVWKHKERNHKGTSF